MYISLPTGEGSRIPLFADATGHWGWPRESDPPPRRLIPHQTVAGNLYDMAHVFCIPRHGRKINIVFLDGHARTVPLEELWQLKWNNVWVATNVTLPPK
jgi:prepilin-type processing-associated H-X9-DG protein